MAKIPYFPFYPDDWISSRKRIGLTYKQQGIYMLLLAHAWHNPLPVDRFRLQQLVPGARYSDIEKVLSICFSTANEQHTNDKLTAIRRQSEDKQLKASYAAKCSHNKESHPADAERTHSERSANQNQNQNQNHIKTKTRSTTLRRTKISFNAEIKKLENISPDFEAMLKEKFPGVDYAQKISTLEAWLFSNPEKRKSNYERFLTNCFSKEQDKPRGGNGNGQGKGSFTQGSGGTRKETTGDTAVPGKYAGIGEVIDS